jgi:hypothetical protein
MSRISKQQLFEQATMASKNLREQQETLGSKSVKPLDKELPFKKLLRSQLKLERIIIEERSEALAEYKSTLLEKVIGEDEVKVENKDDDDETWCNTCGFYYGGEYDTKCNCEIRNQLRAEQRKALDQIELIIGEKVE